MKTVCIAIPFEDHNEKIKAITSLQTEVKHKNKKSKIIIDNDHKFVWCQYIEK